MSLVEISKIALKRNEIQTRRQGARHKLYRAKRHLEAMQIHNNICKMRLALSVSQRTDMKRGYTHPSNQTESLTNKLANANKASRWMDDYLMKKYSKLSIRDMKLEISKLEVQFHSIQCELKQFTKDTTRKVRRMLKALNASYGCGDGQNKIKHIDIKDGKSYNVKDMQRIVDNHTIETMLLVG